MLDLDFHLTEEGQSALSCLRNPVTSAPKKIFGILERPAFPPTFQQIHLKLALIGKSGVSFFATFTICMIEHQEDRELMTNEDNDDDESDEVIIPASSKGKN